MTNEDVSLCQQIAIDSMPERCGEVKQEILGILKAFGFPQMDSFAIETAIEEALANALKHGNRYDPSRKIGISYRITRNEFRIRIRDEGDGFDPLSVPDPTAPKNIELPTGRGLLMMRHFMTGLRYNQCGNSLEMWKCRGAKAGAKTGHQ